MALVQFIKRAPEHVQYMDTPYAQIPVYRSKIEQQKKHTKYKRVHGTSKQEWMDEEDSCYK